MLSRPQRVQRSQTFSSHEKSKTHNKSFSVSQSVNISTQPSHQYEKSGETPRVMLPSTLSLSSSLVTRWIRALDCFNNGRLNEALRMLQEIQPPNSKVTYNIASIYATLGDHESAVVYFKRAIDLDNYMAISHFQTGVSRFLSGQYIKAAASFNTALKLLRGNPVINYQQLGLEYKLYSCEIMYNRALAYIYSGQMSVGIYDMGFAVKERRYIPEHAILDDALKHFSQDHDDVQSDKKAKNTQPTLKTPAENNAKSSQRFSVLGPPKAGPAQSSPPAEEVKHITYSLFSVPQGALYRLRETEGQAILNDKYVSAVLGAPGQDHKTSNGSSLPPALKSSNSTPANNFANSTTIKEEVETPFELFKQHGQKSSNGSTGSNSSLSLIGTPLRQPKNMPILPTLPNSGPSHGVTSSISISPVSVSSQSHPSTPSSASSYTHSSTNSSPDHDEFHNRQRPRLPSVTEQPHDQSYKSNNINNSNNNINNSNNIINKPMHHTVRRAVSNDTGLANAIQVYPSGISVPSVPPPRVLAKDLDSYGKSLGPAEGQVSPKSPPPRSSERNKQQPMNPNFSVPRRHSSRTRSNSSSATIGGGVEGGGGGRHVRTNTSALSQQQQQYQQELERQHQPAMPPHFQLKRSMSQSQVQQGPVQQVPVQVQQHHQVPHHHPSEQTLHAPPSPPTSVTKLPVSTTTSSSGLETVTPSPLQPQPPTQLPSMPSMKVKVHFENETRVMMLHKRTSFGDFKRRIANKVELDRAGGHVDLDALHMRIKDEDGDFVLLGDQEDLDVAIDELCAGCEGGGGPGAKIKLAVYVEVV